MKSSYIITFCGLIVILWHVAIWAQENLNNGIISSGASNSSNTDFKINGTIAQPLVNFSSNGSYRVSSGFWPGFGLVVRVEDELSIPNNYELFYNYPNPFNPSTTIKYSIIKPGRVTLILYNSLGQKVETLIDEEKTIGTYSIAFDAKNISSGIYFYRIVANDFVETKRMILLK
jgi:hypothetical protein